MIELVKPSPDAADIIGRFMAEMEEVFGLIDRPRTRAAADAAAEPAPPPDALPLAT